MTASRNAALLVYAAAVAAIVIGVSVAMARYPGGFDWVYTVISRLASTRHNPDGGRWLSGGLLVGAGPQDIGHRQPNGSALPRFDETRYRALTRAPSWRRSEGKRTTVSP